jgi:hypothetical protein
MSVTANKYGTTERDHSGCCYFRRDFTYYGAETRETTSLDRSFFCCLFTVTISYSKKVMHLRIKCDRQSCDLSASNRGLNGRADLLSIASTATSRLGMLDYAPRCVRLTRAGRIALVRVVCIDSVRECGCPIKLGLSLREISSREALSIWH